MGVDLSWENELFHPTAAKKKGIENGVFLLLFVPLLVFFEVRFMFSP